LAKIYGRVEIDPNHFFSQAIEIIGFASILYKVNGTVVINNIPEYMAF